MTNTRLGKGAMDKLKLKHRDLRAVCNGRSFGAFRFEDTRSIVPLEGFIGQERAMEALEFGLRNHAHGWNIFAVEPSGARRSSTLNHAIRSMVPHSDFPEVHDIVCVHNFKNPESPQFIKLARGKASGFAEAINELGRTLQRKTRAYIESMEHLGDIKTIEAAHTAKDPRFSHINDELSKHAIKLSVGIIAFRFFVTYNGGSGVRSFLKTENEERPLTDEEANSLSKEEDKERSEYTEMLGKMVIDQFQDLILGTATDLGEAVQELKKKYVDDLFVSQTEDFATKHGEAVLAYIDDLRKYASENVDDLFLESGAGGMDATMGGVLAQQHREDAFRPFRVKVFVDNSKIDTNVPIVFEDDPTYKHLFGEIGHKDHTTVRSGSFIRANGGVLVLPMENIIQEAGVWERLVSVISSGNFELTEMPGVLPFVDRGGLTPEAISDVSVKVILVGSAWLYGLMLDDPLFKEQLRDLFRVTAEFDGDIPRTKETTKSFVRLVSAFCAKEKLLPFNASAVVGVLNYALRIAESRDKFSLDMRAIKDIVIEAAQWARAEDSDRVSEGHVRKALEKSVYRVSFTKEKVYEQIQEGLILLDLEGNKVGQVNGLSVYDTGDILFGGLQRITAQTFVGRSGVVDIEELAWPSDDGSHKKSFEIIKGHLGGKYARQFSLSFSAFVSFEQRYGESIGDSASLAEFYVILSSLSEFPLNQGIAVTGSMNQMGEVQPIGGVIHKIEGFFDVCSARGLTGDQGVIIPRQNKSDLVLRDDVVEAVQEGKFHIWAISHIGEGLEILTGVKMGEVTGKIEDGPRSGHDKYEEGTVNHLVAEKLWKLTKAARVSRENKDKDNPEDKSNDD